MKEHEENTRARDAAQHVVKYAFRIGVPCQARAKWSQYWNALDPKHPVGWDFENYDYRIVPPPETTAAKVPLTAPMPDWGGKAEAKTEEPEPEPEPEKQPFLGSRFTPEDRRFSEADILETFTELASIFASLARLRERFKKG